MPGKEEVLYGIRKHFDCSSEVFLKSVLFVLKAVLYGAKLFLLLFVLVARVFLIFAKAAVPQ